MNSTLPAITKEQIMEQLVFPGFQVFSFSEIDSTNEECKRQLKNGIRKCIIIADKQSHGKGRTGKTFFSPQGGLYISISFPASDSPINLTCRAAVITLEAVEALCRIRCGIKWVNDLFYNGKKVCGILTEQMNGNIVVGIGINLQSVPVPDELKGIVGFLDSSVDRVKLAGEISKRLIYSDQDTNNNIMDRYRSNSILLGKSITCLQGSRSFSAVAVGIDELGGLEVLGPNGKETLYFGEVSVRVNSECGET